MLSLNSAVYIISIIQLCTEKDKGVTLYGRGIPPPNGGSGGGGFRGLGGLTPEIFLLSVSQFSFSGTLTPPPCSDLNAIYNIIICFTNTYDTDLAQSSNYYNKGCSQSGVKAGLTFCSPSHRAALSQCRGVGFMGTFAFNWCSVCQHICLYF